MPNGQPCALCHDTIDLESPFMTGGIFEKNPLTFRMAWMHGWCFKQAVDELKLKPAKNYRIFDNRHDEYLEAIQH